LLKDPNMAQVGYNITDAEGSLQPDGDTDKYVIEDTPRSVAALPTFYDAVILTVKSDSAIADCIKAIDSGLTMDQIRELFQQFHRSPAHGI